MALLDVLTSAIDAALREVTATMVDLVGLMTRDAEASLRAVAAAAAAAGGVFGQATAAVRGFAAAASPEAAETLRGSIQLLVATVGQEFVPVIGKVAFAIQDAAHWFGGLSEETKGLIVQLTLGGVAAAGVVVAIGRVVAVVQSLAPAATVAARALTALWAVAAAHPLVAVAAAIGAVTVAVLAMRGAFGQAEDAVGGATERLASLEALLGRLREGGAPGRKELEEIFSLAERRELERLRGRPEELKRYAAGLAAEARGRVRPVREVEREALEAEAGAPGAQEEYRRRFLRAAFQRRFMTEAPPPTGSAAADAVRRRQAEAEARAEAAGRIAVTGELPGGVPRHALARPREMTAQFTAIERAREAFQLSLLQRDPLQQELMEIRRRSYERLVNIEANTGRIPAGGGRA